MKTSQGKGPILPSLRVSGLFEVFHYEVLTWRTTIFFRHVSTCYIKFKSARWNWQHKGNRNLI